MSIRLFIIFIAALLIDGIILPALFGFNNSLLSFLVLIIPALYLGPEKKYVAHGFFFSLILESFKGFDPGSLALPFLLTVVLIYLAQRSLDIKFTYETRFGVGKSLLIASVSVVFIYILSVFYRWGGISVELISLVIGSTVLLEALALSLILNAVLNKRDYFLNS